MKELKQLKKSKWEILLKLIHNKKIGSKILRREIVNKSYINRYSTIDSYRSLLTKLGVLETESPGVYIKRKQVKTNWSVSYIREITDQNSWKSWFIQID